MTRSLSSRMTAAAAVVCAAYALVLASPSPVSDGTVRPAWSLRATAGPAPRAEFGLAYDSARGVTVLFGGANCLAFTCVFPDTWEWDGNAWLLRSNSGPAPRCDHAMAYDSIRGVTVLFGGYNGTYFSDTWEWDGNSWTNNPVSGPAARADSFMVFDTARGVMVLFGGQRANGTIAGDTWEYDGSSWMLRATTGPAPRWIQRMAFESARQVTVMFGGLSAGNQPLNDTWEWNGTSWALQPIAGPSARFGNAMAYDSAREMTVLFGGGVTFTAGLGDTWELDQSGWAQLPIAGPSPRTFVKMAYDSGRCRTVLVGGYGGGQFRNDTWELSAAAPGDATCDLLVNIEDFLAVLQAWGPCPDPPAPGSCPADVAPPPEGDGVVNIVDLLEVLINWT